MRLPTIQFNAFTKEERFELTSVIRTIFQNNHGWILDTHSFSNLSLCFHFEVNQSSMKALYQALSESGLDWTSRTERQWLESLEAAERAGEGELFKGSLQLTFVHDKPPLRQKIPAIPS